MIWFDAFTIIINSNNNNSGSTVNNYKDNRMRLAKAIASVN